MSEWNLSCPDWEKRLVAGFSLIPDLPLFRDEAEMAVSMFNALQLPDVPGTPTMEVAAGDWFRELVATIFGSRDPLTNLRFIREAMLMVPKGNSKTTNGAALTLTALMMNKRPRAEFLLVAPTQAIAELAFNQADGMIQLNPELAKRYKVRSHLKEIVDLVTKAKMSVKTFDLNVLTGPKPVWVLVDELHQLGKSADTSKVLTQIRGGLEKMTEGFLLFITTQSNEPPVGAWREELNAARAIRDGRITGRMLPVMYEFPDKIARSRDEWQRPNLWTMVNPNMGRSIKLDSLEANFQAAQAKGESALRDWASQHLNIEIGLGLKTDRWRGADHWEAADEKGLTLEVLLKNSEVAVVGIDGGGLDDLLGLVVIGREKLTKRWLAWGHAWAHESVLALRKSEASKFEQFTEAGELTLVDDMELAIGEAADIAARVDAAGLLAKVGLDPFSVGAIVDAMADRDIGGEGDDRVVGIPQGWQLNGAIKTSEIKLANKTLLHGGQGLMAWAVSNAKTEPKGNAVTITKAVAGAGKIDPLMAMFDAVVLMSKNPQPPEGRGPSIYESRGMLVV